MLAFEDGFQRIERTISSLWVAYTPIPLDQILGEGIF